MAVDKSPLLGRAGAVTVTESGMTKDDVTTALALFFLAKQVAKWNCFQTAARRADFVAKLAKVASIYVKTQEQYRRGLYAWSAKIYADLVGCLATASETAIELLTGASSRAHASTACAITPFALRSRRRHGKNFLRSIHVGGVKGLSVSCSLDSGVLKLRVASKSGKPLRGFVGPRLFVGVARSKRDPAGGSLSFSFRKG